MLSRNEISHPTWNALVLGIIVALGIAAIAINYKLNVFGVFGNVSGKKLVVYDNERSTKFLFSYNYIPSNFDGLLVGSSISDNWNTGLMTTARIYNASLMGGNISEEALIVDKVLQRSHPTIVLFLIYPYLTKSHGSRSGFMNPNEYWGALGSVQLAETYWSKWLIDRGYSKLEFNEFGSDDFEARHHFHPGGPDLAEESWETDIDSAALKEYGDLVQRVRASGARVAGVMPPVKSDVWNKHRAGYLRYYGLVTRSFQPGEPIIDLNALASPQFLADRSNFPDGIHLSTSAAKEIVGIIDGQIGQYVAQASKQTNLSDR